MPTTFSYAFGVNCIGKGQTCTWKFRILQFYSYHAGYFVYSRRIPSQQMRDETIIGIIEYNQEIFNELKISSPIHFGELLSKYGYGICLNKRIPYTKKQLYKTEKPRQFSIFNPTGYKINCEDVIEMELNLMGNSRKLVYTINGEEINLD